MVTYYLGSSYGGTVTSGPQPQPSPPQSWKREYRSSTFNKTKAAPKIYTNGRVKTSKSPTYLGSSIYSQAHHGDRNGLRKDLVPLALPPLGKAHVKRPWGIEMRGSGLHLSTLSLFRMDLNTRDQQHCMCVLEVGMVLLLHHFSASPCDFPGGAALWIKLPVLQNKVQNKAKAGGCTRPCALMKGEWEDWKYQCLCEEELTLPMGGTLGQQLKPCSGTWVTKEEIRAKGWHVFGRHWYDLHI